MKCDFSQTNIIKTLYKMYLFSFPMIVAMFTMEIMYFLHSSLSHLVENLLDMKNKIVNICQKY